MKIEAMTRFIRKTIDIIKNPKFKLEAAIKPSKIGVIKKNKPIKLSLMLEYLVVFFLTLSAINNFKAEP